MAVIVYDLSQKELWIEPMLFPGCAKRVFEHLVEFELDHVVQHGVSLLVRKCKHVEGQRLDFVTLSAHINLKFSLASA